MNKVLLMITVLLCVCQSYGAKLRIGVTLHPYYSFVKNIVQDRAEVLPVIESGGNVHGYRVTPQDIKRAMGMDVLVVNGVGHDEFAFEILKAAGIEKKMPLIYANKDVALIPQSVHSSAINSHSFVSITAAIQQVYTIANGLAELDQANAAVFRQNASRYAGQLRRMKAEYMAKLRESKDLDFRCATIHGGYSYLLQEFGFQVDEVIEPGHGLTPSASQLKEMIQRIKSSGVRVIFTERDFPSDFARTMQQETGCTIESLSHLSKGAYSAENFEQGMRLNLDALLNAVQGVRK